MKWELPEIRPEQRTPLVDALVDLVRQLLDHNRQLEETVQQLRDEIAVLKGQKPRPPIQPSRLEDPKPKSSTPPGGKRPGSAKRPKTTELTIHRELPLHAADLPAGTTLPLLLEQLWEYGIDISAGQLHRILTEDHEGFHQEKDAVRAAGLAESSYVGTDDSGGTRSEGGRRCRDTFASLKKTCRKLGVRFWDDLQDRVRGLNQIPRLAALIRQRGRPEPSAARAPLPI